MHRVLAILVCCLATSPALALSCMAPSVQLAFAAAHAATEVHVPVLGQFSGFTRRSSDRSKDDSDRTYTALFSGKVVTASGFGQLLSLPVQITEQCFGVFCPAFAPDSQVLTFLRRDDAGYAFLVDACHGSYFSEPGPEQLGILRDCLADMVCPDN